MAKHTAHGYLVDDVYKEAEEYTRIFGHHPSRIDETFAGSIIWKSQIKVQ